MNGFEAVYLKTEDLTHDTYEPGETGLVQTHSVLLVLSTDGRNVLEQLKQDQGLKEIPIIVFTTSSNPKDISQGH